MSLVPSESNLNISLPLNLMLWVLRSFMSQSGFKIPIDCLLFPCFLFFSFLIFLRASISTFLPFLYLGILGYGDHDHSEKVENLIKAV